MPEPHKLVVKNVLKRQMPDVRGLNLQGQILKPNLVQLKPKLPVFKQTPKGQMSAFQNLIALRSPRDISLLGQLQDDKTPLPLRTDPHNNIAKDRFDQNLRWVSPSIHAAPIGTLTTPIFTAIEDGPDLSGNTIYSAVLRIPVEEVVEDKTKQDREALKAKNGALDFRQLDLSIKSTTLSLPYLTDEGTQKTIQVTGRVSEDQSYVDFPLQGPAVKLAYRQITKGQEAQIKIVSSYQVWAKTERVVKKPVDQKTINRMKREIISQSQARSIARLQTRQAMPGMIATQGRQKQRGANRWIPGRRRASSKSQAAPKKTSSPTGFLDLESATEAKSLLHQKTHAAYIARQSVEVVFSKENALVETVRPITLSAVTDPQHFVMLDPQTGEPVVFGDNPPWEKGYVSVGRTAKKLNRSDITLSGATNTKVEIYESLIEPGRFIVIPKTYVVTRDPFTGKPLFAASQLSNPEEPEQNEIIIDVGLAPDITQEDRFLIQQALQDYARDKTPAGQSVPQVYFDLPTDLGEEFKLTWSDPLSQARKPVIDGEIILLPLTANSLTSASLMFDQLSIRSRGLYGSLEFALPDDDIGTISLFINLCRTTGPAVQLSRESVNGAPKIRALELAGREHQIRAILALGPEGGLTETPITPIKKLGPDEEALFDDPYDGQTQITISTDEQTPMSVEINPRRYDIGDTLQGLIITTMLMPDMTFVIDGASRALRDLAVEIRSSNIPAVRHPITFDTTTGIFHNVVLTWDMPLHLYLNPANRFCECKLTANFTDGHSRQTDWINHDYGNNPDFTIRREHFN